MSFWVLNQMIDLGDFWHWIGSQRTGKWRSGGGDGGDVFREFEDMRREMERMFEEQLRDIQSIAPKEFVREYEQLKVIREIGPLVNGYSVTTGPDGKLR
jgi:hypothetical protein